MPVTYLVRFPAPDTHYAEVEALMPCVGHSQLDLFLPVWTPGSYLVREYSRHLEAISVATGARIEKTRKNRWRVFLDQAQDEIRLRYSVYCH